MWCVCVYHSQALLALQAHVMVHPEDFVKLEAIKAHNANEKDAIVQRQWFLSVVHVYDTVLRYLCTATSSTDTSALLSAVTSARTHILSSAKFSPFESVRGVGVFFMEVRRLNRLGYMNIRARWRWIYIYNMYV